MDEEEGPRSFAHLIGTGCEGQINLDASADLHELLVRLQAEAKHRRAEVKGEITLKLTFAVTDNDIAGLTYSIKLKAPEPRRQTEQMWLTKGGNLSRENPRQTSFDLREVPGGRTEQREVRANQAMKEV